MFIRALSLSKFRSWLTDDFSSNKAAASLQPLHSETEKVPHRVLEGDEQRHRKVASPKKIRGDAGEGPIMPDAVIQ